MKKVKRKSEKSLEQRTVVLQLLPEHWKLIEKYVFADASNVRTIVSTIVREVCRDDIQLHGDTLQ